MWTPDPAPPFEVLVIAPGGIYMKPVLVERLTDNVVELVVEPMVRELVTVSGSAGSIETTPAAGTATLTSTEIQNRERRPNLIQALENVPASIRCRKVRRRSRPPRPGARTHADSARWRAGVLGASCRSERDLSRSRRDRRDRSGAWTRIVAYGSDAFGGVISVRTERRAAGSLWRSAFRRHAGRVASPIGAGRWSLERL